MSPPPANDNPPVLHPFILEYRERATHLITALSQLSANYLTHLAYLRERSQISPGVYASGWNEFIAAHTCQPAAVLLAAPSGVEATIAENLLSILHAQLTQVCRDKGLVLRWDVSATPAIITEQ